jgi:hypothetical protein
MSEQNGYSKGLQINTNIAGDLFNFRAGDGEELKDLLQSVAKHAEPSADALVDVKQVFLAKNVVAGTTTTTTTSAPGPSSEAPANTSPDGTPRCKHGEVKDLTGQSGKNGKLYQWRYYCPADWNAPDKCKSQDIPGNQKQG